jgi:hypothetical protein
VALDLLIQYLERARITAAAVVQRNTELLRHGLVQVALAAEVKHLRVAVLLEPEQMALAAEVPEITAASQVEQVDPVLSLFDTPLYIRSHLIQIQHQVELRQAQR